MTTQRYLSPANGTLQETGQDSYYNEKCQDSLEIFIKSARNFFEQLIYVKGHYDSLVLSNVDQSETRSTLEAFVLRSFMFEGNLNGCGDQLKQVLNKSYNIVSKIIEVSPGKNVIVGVTYLFGYIYETEDTYCVPVFRVYRNNCYEEPMIVDTDANVHENVKRCIDSMKLPASLISVIRHNDFQCDRSFNALPLQFYLKVYNVVYMDKVQFLLINCGVGIFSMLYLGPIGPIATLSFSLGYYTSFNVLNSRPDKLNTIFLVHDYCKNSVKILSKIKQDFMPLMELFDRICALINVVGPCTDSISSKIEHSLSLIRKEVAEIFNILLVTNLFELFKILNFMYRMYAIRKANAIRDSPSQEMMRIIDRAGDDYTLDNFLMVSGLSKGELSNEGNKYMEGAEIINRTGEFIHVLTYKNGNVLYMSSAPMATVVDIVRNHFQIPESVPFQRRNENIGKLEAHSLGTFVFYHSINENDDAIYVLNILDRSAADLGN